MFSPLPFRRRPHIRSSPFDLRPSAAHYTQAIASPKHFTPRPTAAPVQGGMNIRARSAATRADRPPAHPCRVVKNEKESQSHSLPTQREHNPPASPPATCAHLDGIHYTSMLRVRKGPTREAALNNAKSSTPAMPLASDYICAGSAGYAHEGRSAPQVTSSPTMQRAPLPSFHPVSLTTCKRSVTTLILERWKVLWKVSSPGHGLREIYDSPPSLILRSPYSFSAARVDVSILSQLRTDFSRLMRTASVAVSSLRCVWCRKGDPYPPPSTLPRLGAPTSPVSIRLF
ncbi:hypothetical protein B0H14DRAFT_3466619 [Mycena olivaceomarginata]|nr:hypothetical protein B0H14DRAFT_3466619 [Mycena olivaceomarginata]